MAAEIINASAEGRGLFLTCNNNLSSPMMAAWFQSITSEKGNSHPLLSMTGTQAACGHRARPPSAAAPPPRQASSFPPTPSPRSLHKLSRGTTAKNIRNQKPQEGSPSVYSFPFWVYSYALKGGVCTDGGICHLVLTLPDEGRTVQCSRWNTGEFNTK